MFQRTWKQVQRIPANVWICMLLMVVPGKNLNVHVKTNAFTKLPSAGFATKYAKQPVIIVFVTNFIAIIPLALLLNRFADDLATMMGGIVGALINTTFRQVDTLSFPSFISSSVPNLYSNAVQLMLSVFLLRDHQIEVLQTSLIGAILSSMHLMLGLGFLFGGVKRFKQFYSKETAHMFGTMLLLSMTSLIIPTVAKLLVSIGDKGVILISRGISITLLCVYFVFLYFSLESHAELFNDPVRKVSKWLGTRKAGETKMEVAKIGGRIANSVTAGIPIPDKTLPELHTTDTKQEEGQKSLQKPRAGDPARLLAGLGHDLSAVAGEAEQYVVEQPAEVIYSKPEATHNPFTTKRKHLPRPQKGATAQQFAEMGSHLTTMGGEAEQFIYLEPPKPKIPPFNKGTNVIALALLTTILGFNTTFATDSLDGLIENTGLSTTFIGIVLLPLLSNDIGVIKSAVEDHMDLCVLLTVGKCVQITLFVIPFTVLLGWMIGVDLELSFDGFEVAALFASVLYINSMISEGQST